jgi:hypothetical protein
MADMPKYFGLCETCEHDATCTLRRSSQLEVIQCEEFSTQPIANEAISIPKEAAFSDLAEIARMGLCSNCLHVVSCGFPNARHGVLQCEEYALGEADLISPVRIEYSRSAA